MASRNGPKSVFRVLSTNEVLELENELLAGDFETSGGDVMAAIAREEGLIDGFGFEGSGFDDSDFSHVG